MIINLKNKTKILLVLGALLLLLLGVSTVFLFFGARPKGSQIENQATQVKTKDSPKVFNSDSEKFPFDFLNISGKVTQIKESAVVFEADINGKKYSFEAGVVGSTKLMKKTVNKEKPIPGKPFKYFTSEVEIHYDDIQQGDTIVVESVNDILKNHEFEAKAISVITNP
jgi:hypothetical protein